MIELRNFSIGYDNNLLLDNISANIREERLTALIGRNGSGKSTLLKAICGLSDNYNGKILIDGTDLTELSDNVKARSIAYVNTQRPRLHNLTCLDIVALGRSPYTGWIGNLNATDKEFIEKALVQVGMENFRFRQINSLSDGEAQRVMIARAIAQETKIIVLDEPTSFLDMPNRFEITNLLRELAHEKNKTIIFSTHELDIALEMSDDISIISDQHLYNLPVSEMIESGHIQRLFHMQPGYIDRFLSMARPSQGK